VIGPQAFGENQELIFLGREVSRSQSHSEATSEKIDAEISRLIREACDRADALLTAHRDTLRILVERLLEEETMDGREVADLAKLGRFLTREELAEREMQESRARAEKESEALAHAQTRAAAQAVISAPATHAVAMDGEAPSPPPAPPV
jgi:cell division protease FtsH